MFLLLQVSLNYVVLAQTSDLLPAKPSFGTSELFSFFLLKPPYHDMEIITPCGQISFLDLNSLHHYLPLLQKAGQDSVPAVFNAVREQKGSRKIEADYSCALASLTEGNGSGPGFGFLPVTPNAFSSNATGGIL